MIYFPPDGLGFFDTLAAPSPGRYDVIISPLPLLIAGDVTIMNGVVFHLRFFNVAHKQDASLHVPGRHDAGLSSRADHARKLGEWVLLNSCTHWSLLRGLSCRGRRTPPLVRPDDRIASCMGASLPAPKHLQGSRILCENLRPGGRNPTGFMGRSPSSDYPDSSPGSLSRQSNVSIPHSHPLHSERPEPKSTSLRAR